MTSTLTDQAIAEAYNALDRYPTLTDVAKALGVSLKTVKNRVGVIRRTVGAPLLIDRKAILHNQDNPISERPALFHEHWTPEDCVVCLRDFWNLHGDEEISRARFRRESGVSESTWNRYFGTFEEFKRQAGVKLSRGQRQLELNIAKHASRDPMEQFAAERAEYAGKYLKPNDRRWKTALVASDFHDEDCDPFVRRLFVDTARRVQPDVIFLNGDMLDLPEFGKYTVDPRTWDVLGRIGWLHRFLADLRTAAPNAEIIYLEGNHEFRLLRHLAEATPALKTILADLHGFTMPKLLGLDVFEVNYVGKANLRAWSNKDVTKELHSNTYFLWDMLLADHFPQGIDQGVPGWNGHHHKWRVTPINSRIFGSSMWVQLAGGHVANAEYCEGEKWQTGFMLVHADTVTKRAVFEPIDVRDFAVIGGQFYGRQTDERWHANQEVYA